jgi:hypothetical protein
MSRYIGQSVEVLWERDMDDMGRPLGTTRNYLNIAANRASDLTRQGQTSIWTIKGFVSEDRMLAVPSEIH